MISMVRCTAICTDQVIRLYLDIVVSLDQASFMILEGTQVIVCASLMNTTLGRNLSIMFIIEQSDATGIIKAGY